MSIDGRINVDCLFHDKDGTASLKVVSLQESTAYTTGKVAVITGTAGTAGISFSGLASNQTGYRDASGQLVNFTSGPSRIAFSWSGANERILQEVVDNTFLLRSRNNSVSVSDCSAFTVVAEMPAGGGTGTYTILLLGT